MDSTELIRVEGIVQGVGFRPAVWRLAHHYGICGWVRNDAGGVLIEIWGNAAQRDSFVDSLQREKPPLARIDSLTRCYVVRDEAQPADFRIIVSEAGDARTGVAPDASTCPACLAETLDPNNRRFGYAFTNCTHCGPRLSIVRAIPYDRPNTSMARFSLCAQCQREYDDPSDRRFHAQPTACPVCGPRLWLEKVAENLVETTDPIAATAELLQRGQIVAIKGLGSFHLACDASNASAVARLRVRKQRYKKAFALMARSADTIRPYALVSAEEQALLESSAAPIVLLSAKSSKLPAEIAPGQHRIGFMLPYTPLHHLLLRRLDSPIVLTSGNRSDEPPCTENDEAKTRLGSIADAFLMHDRDIVNRLDDSVVHFVDGRPRMLRRARGYAPEPLLLPKGFECSPQVLAMGAELKNSFCLIKDGKAILSQHMGDLEDSPTRRDYQHHLNLYCKLFTHTPTVIAVDCHPDYVSTQLGKAMAKETAIPCLQVQHHHAHIATCLAEHGHTIDTPKVVGIALDGLGYGDDGQLWGGEFLIADYLSYKRVGSFTPVAMPGSFKCIKEPWRNAYAHLNAGLGWAEVVRRYASLACVRYLQSKPLTLMEQMISQRINSPRASSCGRLFDAAATLLGIGANQVSYEGQAACELEAMACGVEHAEPYRYRIVSIGELQVIEWQLLWNDMLDDLLRGTQSRIIAARFHAGVASATAELALELCQRHRLNTVVLGGGSFQNRRLAEETSKRLRLTGVAVMAPEKVPTNDGGIALGQAVVAAARFATRYRL
jgi:hydrogenase maturation protein HypF